MIHETNDPKLISGAAEFFKANPAMKEMFVSEDGQYFFTVSASTYHIKQRGLKLFRLERAQVEETAKSASKPAAKKTAAKKKTADSGKSEEPEKP